MILRNSWLFYKHRRVVNAAGIALLKLKIVPIVMAERHDNFSRHDPANRSDFYRQDAKKRGERQRCLSPRWMKYLIFNVESGTLGALGVSSRLGGRTGQKKWGSHGGPPLQTYFA